MKELLKLEEAALFIACIFLFNTMDLAWWWFFAFILAPDLGMLGYLVGTRVGATTYNLCHHKGIALLVLVLGYWLQMPLVAFAGCILLAHSALDRVFGYGLKYMDSFKHTHLGQLK